MVNPEEVFGQMTTAKTERRYWKKISRTGRHVFRHVARNVSRRCHTSYLEGGVEVGTSRVLREVKYAELQGENGLQIAGGCRLRTRWSSRDSCTLKDLIGGALDV
jgi:uncharacterized radical SAM superfamily protein